MASLICATSSVPSHVDISKIGGWQQAQKSQRQQSIVEVWWNDKQTGNALLPSTSLKIPLCNANLASAAAVLGADWFDQNLLTTYLGRLHRRLWGFTLEKSLATYPCWTLVECRLPMFQLPDVAVLLEAFANPRFRPGGESFANKSESPVWCHRHRDCRLWKLLFRAQTLAMGKARWVLAAESDAHGSTIAVRSLLRRSISKWELSDSIPYFRYLQISEETLGTTDLKRRQKQRQDIVMMRA